MPATALALTSVPETGTGLEAILVAPTQTTGHTSPCATDAALAVKNASGGAVTVTLYTPGTVHGLAIADRTVSVNAGQTWLIPLPPDLYGDPVTGLALFDLSAFASVTIAAVRLA